MPKKDESAPRKPRIRRRKPAAKPAERMEELSPPSPADVLAGLDTDLDKVRSDILGINPQELGDSRVMAALNAIERAIRIYKQNRLWPMAGDHYGEEGL